MMEDVKRFLDENEPMQARISMTVIVMSDCFYLWYFIKSLDKGLKTRDWRFLFPFLAALFAFTNNLNDIFSFLFSDTNYDCKDVFFKIFTVTATLNWTPISWIQTLRLMSFTKIFYKKPVFILITVINILLSLLYTISYYFHLSNYELTNIGTKTNNFMFCSVTQNKKEFEKGKTFLSIFNSYIKAVMTFDILDSAFSLGILLFTAFMAMDRTQHLKFHHAKIKRMVEEGFIQFIILIVSKIIIYTIMFQFMDQMLFDVIWDLLSVIVIVCAFRLVNVKYKKIKRKFLFLFFF